MTLIQRLEALVERKRKLDADSARVNNMASYQPWIAAAVFALCEAELARLKRFEEMRNAPR